MEEKVGKKIEQIETKPLSVDLIYQNSYVPRIRSLRHVRFDI